MQVQVSTNGTTWVPLVGSTTVQEPGTLDGSTLDGEPALTGIKIDWTRELFDLRNYLGQTALRLRFEFTSNGSSSYDFSQDDGFHIDNVKVVKTTSTLIVLPVEFISFRGRLLPDETVRLDWEAATDDMHDYFEVERSNNGSDFISLGRGPASAPYWKIDPSPVPGNNFYRIKQRDKDGGITYSSIINIKYKTAFSLTVYPVPFADMLNIKINSAVPGRYTVTLMDITGRKVHEEQIMNNLAGRTLGIHLKQEAAQTFILVVRNSRNEVVATRKIAKE
jgi:carboxypeptidase T